MQTYISFTQPPTMATMLIAYLFTGLILISPAFSLNQGFTSKFIHRESPSSPTYNPTISQYDRLRNSIRRSFARYNHFELILSSKSVSPNDDIQSKFVPDNGEYLMEVSVGTPPVQQLVIADTGSDLIWTQCQPCNPCYKQAIPVFDPRKSSTYKVESCDSESCSNLSQAECSSDNKCVYQYHYGDGSYTTGDVSTDTLTFRSLDGGKGSSFPKVTIGCAHSSKGSFHYEGSGLMGLGAGPLSFVSQLSSTIGGKFSYCMIPFVNPRNSSSTINFGSNAVVEGKGVQSTPIIKGTPETFYYLTLQSVTVGDTKLPYKSSFSAKNDDYGSGEGNIIIDSGTTLTYLPEEFFSDLTSALSKTIKGKQVDDPEGLLQLCYQSKKGGEDLNIPTITLHFTDADLELLPSNTFVPVSESVVCLAIVPATDVAIFGNVAQSNMLVGYDLDEGKVSFKPTDCTKA